MEINVCCLCLKPNTDLINMFSEQGIQLQISNILAKHFWFEVELDNKYEKSICTTCWWKVENFHLFYKQVEENHTNFYALNSIDEVNVAVKVEVKMEGELEIVNESGIADEFDVDDYKNNDYENNDYENNDYENIDYENNDYANNDYENNDYENNDYEDNDYLSTLPQKKSRRKPYKSTPRVPTEEDEKIKNFFKLECGMCSAKFNEYMEVRPHYRSEHQIDGYLICCKKKFLHKVRMLEHIEQHLNPELFKCEICNKVLASKPGLTDHLRTHVPEADRKFKCTVCNKKFVQKYHLNEHMKYHKDKTFKCDQCTYVASANCILRTHIRKMHDISNQILCNVCAKPFRNKTALQIHIETEHTDVPTRVQCKLCKAWLKNKKGLRGHMVRHNISKEEFVCDICEKKVPNKGALRLHKNYAHSEKKTKVVKK